MITLQAMHVHTESSSVFASKIQTFVISLPATMVNIALIDKEVSCIVLLACRFSGENNAHMNATCVWQAESLMILKCALESPCAVTVNIQARHPMTWSQSALKYFCLDLVELAMLITINGNCDGTRSSLYLMPTFLSKFWFLLIRLDIWCIYHNTVRAEYQSTILLLVDTKIWPGQVSKVGIE